MVKLTRRDSGLEYLVTQLKPKITFYSGLSSGRLGASLRHEKKLEKHCGIRRENQSPPFSKLAVKELYFDTKLVMYTLKFSSFGRFVNIQDGVVAEET